MWAKDSVSPTLLCDMYAVSLCYWEASSVLRQYQRPDMSFAWNQAVAALNEDFASPSITSICSGLLEIGGRPVNQITTNICTLGQVVTLAQSLGLHRNPTSWKLTEAEKALRTRLWWCVLIHDYWSSFAHGTPPTIHTSNYDVPLPTQTSLLALGTTETRRRALETFLRLCSLTRILSNILPLVYSLAPNYEDMWKQTRRIECSLDEWETDLPESLQCADNINEHPDGTNGLSSLRFCFLAVKLLLYRVAVRV
jgi:hypothetical protein